MKLKNVLKLNIPTIMIIFGVTGDLSQRKLIPAVMDLQLKNVLPDTFKLVGFSRRDWSDDEFRNYVKGVIQKEIHEHSDKEINKFLNISYFHKGTFDDLNSYKSLVKCLKKIDDEIGQCTNKLFHLAVPPEYYETIFKNLAKSGLSEPCNINSGWTRVLVEKPFGKDPKTAEKLDKMLGNLFKEGQIYRIDHYLAKETIQNILTFRFSNSLFEPIWNNKYVEKVEIKLFEKLDMEGRRGSYYDDVGALRDVGQNHILQMLSLIAMDNPGVMDGDKIRIQRAKTMKALQNMTAKQADKLVVCGQYVGFTKEKGVKSNSKTETYFKIKAGINNKRWQGVPFYLESGKALDESRVEIKVYFKGVIPCFCPQEHLGHTHQNIITFKIQPEEAIEIRFWAKNPDLFIDISPQDLSFDYGKDPLKKFDAYQKVLFDCIAGDLTLFPSTDEIKYSWEFIESVLKSCKKSKLHKYKKGSKGPDIDLL